MNRSNIFGSTKRQFINTMKRECITVTDFFDSNISYDVFFRRSNRGSNSQGKLRLFYAKNTPIHIGTIITLNGEKYIVTSQDGIESDIYFTSLAVKCDVTFVIPNGDTYNDLPFTVVTDKFTVDHGTISIVAGTVVMYTKDCELARSISVNDGYYAFGGYYKVGNNFFNNGLAYFYLERQAMPKDDYNLQYAGVGTINMKSTVTYQLKFLATNNGAAVLDPTIQYSVTPAELASVDNNGVLTLKNTGTITVTASWNGVTDKAIISIINETASPDIPIAFSSIKLSVPSDAIIHIGGSYKTITCNFFNSQENNVTDSMLQSLTRDDFKWTCYIDDEDVTNVSSLITWNDSRTDINQVRIMFADNSSYLTKKLIVRCQVKGISSTITFVISAIK